MIDTHAKLTELADWIDGCLRETWTDLLRIEDMDQRRAAYIAAGDLLIAMAEQRGMTIVQAEQPWLATVSALGLSATSFKALTLSLFQTWHDEARQLLFRDLLDA